MFNTVGVKGKEVILRIVFYLESFQAIANGVSKFLPIFSSVNYRRIYSIHKKKSCFVEDLFFHPKKEEMAFLKIEIT